MRILLIDDDKKTTDEARSVLGKKGYQTDVVTDGLLGLEYILSGIYDLVLLDIILPKLNGLDVVRNARNEGIGVPIILLTAKAAPEDKIKGLDSGADDYLTKPFNAGELLASIRARTRKDKTALGMYLSVGNVRLDSSTYKLCGPEKSVKLTKKEYQLLEYLMLNDGKILSRDMIIPHVWGPDSEADLNNLEVYISYVRKKLKYVGSEATIITTKGVGYSIEILRNTQESLRTAL